MVTLGHERCKNPCSFQPSCRFRTDRADLVRAQRVSGFSFDLQTLEKRFDAVDAGKYHPIITIELVDGVIKLGKAFRRTNFNGRKFDDLAAELLNGAGQVFRLFVRSGNDDSFTSERLI